MTNFNTQEAGSSESEVSGAYIASSTTARVIKGDLVLKNKTKQSKKAPTQQQKIIKASVIRKKLAETNALENTFLDNKM